MEGEGSRSAVITSALVDRVQGVLAAACMEEDSTSSLRQLPCMIFQRETVAYSECDPRWLTEPRAVSIGPYTRHRYHGVARLETMQNHKWLCTGRLIYARDNPSDSAGTTIRRCLETIEGLERRIRAAYFDELRLSSDELILTVLLDACFLIFILMLHADPSSREQFDFSDYLNEELGNHQILSMVKHDLLLLGNQIPFFVIRALCSEIMPDTPHESLVSGALQLFSTIWHCKPAANSMAVITCDKVLHLLHLFHLSVVPGSDQRDEQPRSLQRPSQGTRVVLPPATVLEKAGIRFGPRDNACSFMDVRFSNGALLIPPLQVDDNIGVVLGSLIAFEQLHCCAPYHVTSYVSFMKQLLTGPHDSILLQQRGIIRNMNTATHTTSIFRYLISDDYYYVPCNSAITESFMDTTGYYRRRWLRSFRSPIVGPLMIVLAIFMILSSHRIFHGYVSFV